MFKPRLIHIFNSLTNALVISCFNFLHVFFFVDHFTHHIMLVISFHVVILLPFTTTTSLHNIVMPFFVLLKLIFPSCLLHFVGQGVKFEVLLVTTNNIFL